MTARSPFLVGLAALVATLLSAMGALPPDPGVGAPAPAEAFRCALVLDGAGDGTKVAARVVARDALSGSYALRLRAGGNAIAQAGDFEAAAGETVTLGEATVPGAPADVDGALSVSVAGRSHDCPRDAG